MKTHEEIISNLKEHQSPTPSKWRENAADIESESSTMVAEDVVEYEE